MLEGRKPFIRELPSGLKVAVYEKRDLPLLSLMIFFRVGAVDDPPGKSGLAHLLEHMMFNGSRKFPEGEFDRILESLGGYSNAFTSYDYTGYYEVFPPSALERVLEMERDRLEALSLDPDSFEREKKVVLEERRLTVENSPEGFMEEVLNYISFLEHPYRRPLIGSRQEIISISLEDLKEFYFKYSPENSIVVLAGDIEVSRGMAMVEEFLGEWRNGGQPESTFENESFKGERRAVIKKDVEIESYMLAFRAGSLKDKDEFLSLSLLPYLLTETLSSRLKNVLIEERKIASSVVSWYDPRLGPSLFCIYAEAGEGIEAEVLGNEIKKQLQILKENLREYEFETAVERFSLHEASGLQRVAEIAEAVAKGVLLWNDPLFCLTLSESVRNLDRKKFMERISDVISEDNLVEVILKNG